MGKQRDLNIEEKTKALAWRIDGVSTKVIGQRLGWSQHSIQRLFLMGKTYRRLIARRGLYCLFFLVRGSDWFDYGLLVYSVDFVWLIAQLLWHIFMV
jgi:hypothetical protein